MNLNYFNEYFSQYVYIDNDKNLTIDEKIKILISQYGDKCYFDGDEVIQYFNYSREAIQINDEVFDIWYDKQANELGITQVKEEQAFNQWGKKEIHFSEERQKIFDDFLFKNIKEQIDFKD